ncbi:MAG: oligoendopeptidase F [Acidobacteria bacterium]|nr:oligoendopeptidase F [Acidobacteriota bacterium]
MSSTTCTKTVRALAFALVALLAIGAGFAKADATTTWDLSPIYQSDDTWEGARKGFLDRATQMEAFKGRLGENVKTLADAMKVYFDLQKEAKRLYGYASFRADQDLRDSSAQGMRQATLLMFSDLQARLAWIDPELLGIDKAKLASYLRDPSMAQYRRYFERLEKRRPHVRTKEVEEVISQAARMAGDGLAIGEQLRDAEMTWPTITLADGSTLLVDVNGYTRGRQSDVRADRIASYKAFYETLDQHKNTFAMSLAATVNEHVFNAKVRGYPSALDASLFGAEVDPNVYRMLVREINASLPTLHRYFQLRGTMMGLKDLAYHDMYPSLVGSVDAQYDWQTSKKVVLDGLAPLGKEYVDTFAKTLEGGWVDVYPRPGKRTGAYVSDAAYDVHPYMLLNHQDDYHSMSTLAHEGGHLMHSVLSQKNQPFPTSDYVTFVAEVASTVNEVLVFKDLVGKAKSDDEKLALLGEFLEGMRQTVFRQTMFAEFELAIHETIERGEPLTGEGLNAMYLDLLRRYHGHDQGVAKIDALYGAEWAFIPHFHYDFYVYQYATSFIAATAIAENIQAKKPGAVDAYLAFLKSGSTKPPVELLKGAGVDMNSPEPIRAAMRLMDDVIAQMNAILAKKKK